MSLLGKIPINRLEATGGEELIGLGEVFTPKKAVISRQRRRVGAGEDQVLAILFDLFDMTNLIGGGFTP